MRQKTQVRLVAALSLAQDEIHNPGACRFRGVDITAMIEAVLKEAEKDEPLMKFVREEIKGMAPA